MYTFPILLGALSIHALANRSYSAFIAAKALALDDCRTTPRHTCADASGHAFQGASS
jgi:carbon starvation protein